MRRAVLLAAFVACSAAAFAQTAFAQTAFAQAASAQSASALYESGRTAMLEERYYEAMESFLESLRVNPSYAEPVAALAECFYSLGEFDQALSYVRRARALSRAVPPSPTWKPSF
jgi:tetratricopeptide (TPR) repeat protein